MWARSGGGDGFGGFGVLGSVGDVWRSAAAVAAAAALHFKDSKQSLKKNELQFQNRCLAKKITGILQINPHVPSGRNSRVGGIFLRGKDTEFQFCLKQSIFTAVSERGPPSDGVH